VRRLILITLLFCLMVTVLPGLSKAKKTSLSEMNSFVSVDLVTNQSYSERINFAVERLRKLNIIRQVNVDDIRINENMTRAELVVNLVRGFGQEENAKLLMGFAAFPDTGNHWASGYIAMGKIIVEKNGGEAIGMPDGSFQPDGLLTHSQTVAMIMKFVGAKRVENLSWPEDYLRGAVNVNILTSEDLAWIAPMHNDYSTRGYVFYYMDRAFYYYKFPSGKTVYTTYVDTVAPTVSVDIPSSTVETTIEITGYVSDDTRIVKINQQMANLADGVFNGQVTLIPNQSNTIVIEAEDYAGNITEKTLSVTQINPDEDDVAADTDSLEIGFAAGDTSDSVTKDVVLPVKGENGSVISWVSSDLGTVSVTGVVVRPMSADQMVTLTATISKGSAMQTKQFVIMVKRLLDVTPPTLTVDVGGGTYYRAQTVAITASEEATIYYTLDGSEPTTSSLVYRDPIEITGDTTLNYFAIDLAGNTSSKLTQVYTIIMPVTGWVEENHPALRLSGLWTPFENSSYSGGVSLVGGESVELNFEGVGIRWIASTSENYGLADVYIDGVYFNEVNLYSPEVHYQNVVFEAKGLVEGVHTIMIVKKGILGHPNGKDATINVDAFEVLATSSRDTVRAKKPRNSDGIKEPIIIDDPRPGRKEK
jgi:hypothetical protein